MKTAREFAEETLKEFRILRSDYRAQVLEKQFAAAMEQARQEERARLNTNSVKVST